MVFAIILSGGTGTRMKMGGVPKQYLCCHGRPIIDYSLQTVNDHPGIDRFVVVADREWRPSIDVWMKEGEFQKFFAYADPGENRQLSIKNGLIALERIAEPDDVVIIHDAARPLVTSELITSLLVALPGHDGVMPFLPAKDTFYMLDDNAMVAKELPRERLAAGQAPEAFIFGKYIKINKEIPAQEIMRIKGSTEIALKYDLKIAAVPGEERNFKITTQDDLLLMDKYIGGDRG